MMWKKIFFIAFLFFPLKVWPTDTHSYTVKQNDTLMLIAFQIYGDYLKWRELYALNEDILRGNHDLPVGLVLKFKSPENPYHPPEGNPYLIKRGDSLSLISQKVYGNWEEWPQIYKNNPRQIKDPNLIFTGLTLFYPDLPLNLASH